MGKDEVGPMTHGPDGTILTSSRRTGNLSMLKCDTAEFKLKEKIEIPNKIQPTHVRYISELENIIFSSFEGNIVCTFLKDGAVRWDISDDIKQNVCRPTGIVYIGVLDALLLGDYDNYRMLLLSAKTD